jgi:hypothetical protein
MPNKHKNEYNLVKLIVVLKLIHIKLLHFLPKPVLFVYFNLKAEITISDKSDYRY